MLQDKQRSEATQPEKKGTKGGKRTRKAEEAEKEEEV